MDGNDTKKDDKILYTVVGLAVIFLITYNFILPNIRIGLRVAKDGDLYGYKNVLGMWIIQPVYTEARGFVNGVATVYKWNETGEYKDEFCINKLGDNVNENACYR